MVIVKTKDLIATIRRRQIPKVTQGEAAKIAGVSRATYNGYEAGKPVPPEILMRLADAWKAPELTIAESAEPSNRRPADTVRLPYWGTVPAGDWETPLDNVQFEPVPARMAGDDRFCVRVKGESMVPNMLPGDLLVCRRTAKPPIGSVVLARNGDGELTIKRYLYSGGAAILRADNPDYPTISKENVEFVAEVLHLIRDQV